MKRNTPIKEPNTEYLHDHAMVGWGWVLCLIRGVMHMYVIYDVYIMLGLHWNAVLSFVYPASNLRELRRYYGLPANQSLVRMQSAKRAVGFGWVLFFTPPHHIAHPHNLE